jgi:hypothetical protein
VKRIALCLVLLIGLLPLARADVVVERWGRGRYAQHRDALSVKGSALTFDLSALPDGARVYRARFLPHGGEGYRITATIGGKDVPLNLVPPYDLWFDATDAVRANRKQLALVVRQGGKLDPEKCVLEIACEGTLEDKPKQVRDVKVTYHPGQCLITWKEIWDIAGGKEKITWGEMVGKVRDCNPMVGIIPKDQGREIRYRIYRHTKPITAANLGETELIHEAMPGSIYIDERVARGRKGEHGPVFLKEKQGLVRVTLAPGKTLAPGTGFHAHTVTRPGRAWYAVVTAVNGIENTTDLSDQNVVGPIDQKVTTPMPVLYADRVTKLRRPEGAESHEQWYNWWLTRPLSAFPRRYDVVLSFCPQSLDKPAALSIVRSAWHYAPAPPRRPAAWKHVILTHTMDNPIAFRMGCDSSHNNLKSHEQAEWAPWPMRRQRLLIDWLAEKFEIDRDRVSCSMGAWGMTEIEHPELYSVISGYGQPETTKGFQCWNRSRGVWGPPSVYADRPDDDNPYVRGDFSSYVLKNGKKETPFFNMYPIRSAHLTEMGWPAMPRFWRAMMASRRPFVYNWRVRHRPAFRRDRSVPAFGNCSLDGMPGNGDLHMGEIFDTAINSWLSWDGETIVDRPDRWEMTVILDEGAPLAECTVDLTPRRCRAFRPRPGDTFQWTCTTAEKEGKGRALGSGVVTADKWGLVTLRQMRLVKGDQRVVIATQ